MIAAIYTTREGDVIDLICRHHYGEATVGIVEQVLQANPGLADRGPILPTGISVLLPDIADEALPVVATVRLWD